MYEVNRKKFITWVYLHHPTYLIPPLRNISKDLIQSGECIIEAEDVLKRIGLIPFNILVNFDKSKASLIESSRGLVKSTDCKIIYK